MNMKVNATLQTLALSFLLNGALVNGALAEDLSTDLFGSPFDACFEHGYNVDLLTQNQAFATAQCFTTLLDSDLDAMALGASPHTIRQYAASWFDAAASKGHALALAKASEQRIALNRLEQHIHSDVTDAEWQLLAADTTFQALDADHNGLLSVAEVAPSDALQRAFINADFDQDGVLSIAEYTILNGEATAAGN